MRASSTAGGTLTRGDPPAALYGYPEKAQACVPPAQATAAVPRGQGAGNQRRGARVTEPTRSRSRPTSTGPAGRHGISHYPAVPPDGGAGTTTNGVSPSGRSAGHHWVVTAAGRRGGIPRPPQRPAHAPAADQTLIGAAREAFPRSLGVQLGPHTTPGGRRAIACPFLSPARRGQRVAPDRSGRAIQSHARRQASRSPIASDTKSSRIFSQQDGLSRRKWPTSAHRHVSVVDLDGR